MKVPISVTVNGKKYQHEVEGRLLLVNYLRDVLRLTGAHVGCDTSSCGACNVLLDGRVVKACTLLAAQVDGREIITVEGLASNGELHPLQEGFREEHGLQCGFCTPGMIMSAAQLLEENDDPSETEIREAIEGNFCRCTGYHNIVKAIKYAADKNKGAKLETAPIGGEDHEKEKKLGAFSGDNVEA
jgi:carbon-monoxide dehydrogenase small subunit